MEFSSDALLLFLELRRDAVPDFDRYPFSIPAVRGLARLEFHPRVTFLVGENGTGKSTLLEALAVSAGFNPEGGSRNFRFRTTDRPSVSALHEYLELARGTRRLKDGFFLRAESFFNVATQVERLDQEAPGSLLRHYGGVSLHEQSHGESFLALAANRFKGEGVYLLDEPEAALSPTRQLALLKLLHRLTRDWGAQFVIATHSPLLLAYPDATIYHLSADGVVPIAYQETEHYQVTRDFLLNPEAFLHHLLAEDDQ